jgi:hypothetical protein
MGLRDSRLNPLTACVADILLYRVVCALNEHPVISHHPAKIPGAHKFDGASQVDCWRPAPYMVAIYGACRDGMDFIPTASLSTRANVSGRQAAHSLHPCMECGVEEVETALGEVQGAAEEPGALYSPRDFLQRFGAVIAVCLGLALLANILVTFVGQY